MPWSRRVRPWRIRRLFKLAQMGIIDDDLLMDVGWGLYARCDDVLTAIRALKGEVPCPECGTVVHRPRFQPPRPPPSVISTVPGFACPDCRQALTWKACRESLRTRPRCFECTTPLDWNYADNTLSCGTCGASWAWRDYRRSLKARTRLPCPRCGFPVSRPERSRREIRFLPDPGTPVPDEAVPCPECGRPGTHARGMFQCPSCGYEREWRAYSRRMKRRNTRLACTACGHAFSWHAWRRQTLRKDGFLTTGNPVPAEVFLARWPKCRTPQEQIIQIDNLLHALHARGAMAPLFIEGTQHTALAFLDELAMG